jgi:hypothetical protein
MKAILAVAVITALLLTPFLVQAQTPTPPDVPTLGPIVIFSQGDFINISSPKNQNYPNNPIQLSFTINVTSMLGQFGNVGYSVDNGVVNSIRNLSTTETRPDPNANNTIWYYYTETASTSLDLPQLSNGAHNATVYYGWQYLGVPENPSLQRFEVYAYQTVSFTIGVPVSSSPTVNTGQNTPQGQALTVLVVALFVAAVIIASIILYRYHQSHKLAHVCHNLNIS